MTRIIGWLFHIVYRLGSKRQEFRADYHTYSLGYSDGAISFFEKIKPITAHDSKFFGNLFATHPATMQRIGKLDEYNQDKVPMYASDKVYSKLFPTLTITLLIFGGLLYNDTVHNKSKILQNTHIKQIS